MRCELSDLPAEMCDHCKQGMRTLTDAPALTFYDDINFYKKSDRPGHCVCGEKFSIGDCIGWDKDAQWWRAEKCCG